MITESMLCRVKPLLLDWSWTGEGILRWFIKGHWVTISSTKKLPCKTCLVRGSHCEVRLNSEKCGMTISLDIMMSKTLKEEIRKGMNLRGL